MWTAKRAQKEKIEYSLSRGTLIEVAGEQNTVWRRIQTKMTEWRWSCVSMAPRRRKALLFACRGQRHGGRRSGARLAWLKQSA
jgi:hypothetical protein